MPVSDYTPAVADVGALMFARAHGEYATLETFTAETKPTAAQVTTTIANAAQLVALRIGVDIDAKWHAAGKVLVTLKAALLIEPGHFPEQARPERSAWDEWKAMYDEGIEALVDALSGGGDGDGGSSVEGGPRDAAWSFPPVCPLPW